MESFTPEQMEHLKILLSNPDFKNTLQQWRQIDDALKEERDHIREWKKKQEALGSNIVKFFEDYQLMGLQLKMKDGNTIKYAMSRRQSGLNKNHIFNRLMIWFEGDEEKATRLTEFILGGRQVTEVPRISRRRPRQGPGDKPAVP